MRKIFTFLIIFALIVPSVIEAQKKRLISLSFEKADIHTVLRTFAKLGNINIVASEEVTGEVTLQLRSVPWEHAFQTLLRVHGLTSVEEKGIIGVMTMEESEKQKQIISIETRIFRIKYAKAKKIESTVSSMLTKRGKIKTDERTSSLIVTDIPDVLNEIETLMKTIDGPTRQVMIEAKIVEVDYRTSRELGIDWWVGDEGNSAKDTYFGGGVKTPVAEKGKFIFGTLRDGIKIETQLSMLESQDKANILSQPKIAVIDNEQAMVLSGKKIPIITLDRAGNKIIKFYDVALKLTVTPHINPENQIMLELHPVISDLSSEATVEGGIIILTNEVQTTLMVDNGQTAVIAGVIKEKESKVVRGVPILSKIPLLGRLFKSVSKSKGKTELMVFVTPRIIPIQ